MNRVALVCGSYKLNGHGLTNGDLYSILYFAILCAVKNGG